MILYYFKEHTMARIARSIGKTESRVSQIHGKALEHLRNKLGSRARELMTRLL
jgi:DNA-directed RNA polymerase specialized sigma subunit